MMKKIVSAIFVLIFIVSPAAAFAQTPAVAPVPAASPAGLERVGVIAAAGGGVELKTRGQIGRIAESGQPVFMGDEIKTGEKGHLQLLLIDQTVFTIGPNSALVIDEYVFDPKTNGGKIQASIAKGVFRYVSGKIAAKKADSVSVKLPAATIGFRGTIVGGLVNPDGSGLAALLGPGGNNNTGETIGSFIIQGTGGGSQIVHRTGFGVQFGADGSLSGIFQLSGLQIYNLTVGLVPGGSGSGGGLMGGSATNTSGQGTFLTGQSGGASNSLGSLIGGNNALSIQGAQDEANASAGISDGTTLMSQLSRITTGIFHYDASGTFNSSGSMTAKIDIDFGSRTVGGGNSYVYVSDVGYDDTTSSLPAQSFGSSGNAVFNWSNVMSASEATFDNINVTLKNSNGVVANQATVTTQYTGYMFSGSGSASGPRVDGATPSDPK